MGVHEKQLKSNKNVNFMRTDYWDDINLTQSLKSYDYDLISLLAYSWNIASSGLLIRAIQVIVASFPNYIWKILDVIVFESKRGFNILQIIRHIIVYE